MAVPLTVCIPMAGLGSRFTAYGFKRNKYMLPINEKLETMIEAAIVTVGAAEVAAAGRPVRYVFITRDTTGDVAAELQLICAKHKYEYAVLNLTELTEGPASTAYAAKHLIDPASELIISNSDQVLDWSLSKFLAAAAPYDGCVLTYVPAYDIPLGTLDKHSFVRLEGANKAVEFSEKTAISNTALVGLHWYKRAERFFEAYEQMVRVNLRAPNGEFYLSLTYQAMLALGRTAGISPLDEAGGERFFPTGEPQDYFDYLYGAGGYSPLVTAAVTSGQLVVETERAKIHYVSFSDKMALEAPTTGFYVINGSCTIDSVLYGPNELAVLPAGSVVVASGGSRVDAVTFTHPELPVAPKTHLSKFTRGWLVGDFLPSLYRTRELEVGIMTHTQGDRWEFHYHEHMREVNVLLEGAMTVNGSSVKQGQMFVFEKNQISCPLFDAACRVLCIKLPSVNPDKVIL